MIDALYVFGAIVAGCVLSFGLGYWLGSLAFGKKDASITTGFSEDEIFGACEGALKAEFNER